MQQSAKSKSWKWLLYLVVLPVALFVLYTWIVLSWTYSEGERAGYAQKLSKRGWLCKTWEGELALVTMPGTVAEKFFFTVREEAVATRINQSMGRRVTLDYRQHVGIPSSCFGETGYFVSDVRVLGEPTLTPDNMPAAAPAPAVAPAPAAPAPAPAPSK